MTNGSSALSSRSINRFPGSLSVSSSVLFWMALLVKGQPGQSFWEQTNSQHWLTCHRRTQMPSWRYPPKTVLWHVKDLLWYRMVPAGVHTLIGIMYVGWNAFSLVWLVHQLHLFLVLSFLATAIHALVASILDYCNMLCLGLPLKSVWKIQLV